jgi:hypothetical protein
MQSIDPRSDIVRSTEPYWLPATGPSLRGVVANDGGASFSKPALALRATTRH